MKFCDPSLDCMSFSCYFPERNKLYAEHARCLEDKLLTLLGTNISYQKSLLKMIFFFPRWDMLVPWRVLFKMVIFVRWHSLVFVLFNGPWYHSSTRPWDRGLKPTKVPSDEPSHCWECFFKYLLYIPKKQIWRNFWIQIFEGCFFLRNQQSWSNLVWLTNGVWGTDRLLSNISTVGWIRVVQIILYSWCFPWFS